MIQSLTAEDFRPAPKKITVQEFEDIIYEYQKRGGSIEGMEEDINQVSSGEMSPNLFYFDMLKDQEIIKPLIEFMTKGEEDV